MVVSQVPECLPGEGGRFDQVESSSLPALHSDWL